LGDENVTGGGCGEVLRAFAEEIMDDPPCDIGDIEGALSKVRIIDFAEGLSVAVGDRLEGVFNIELIADEESEDFIDEGTIFDDEEVGIKNASVFGSDGFCDALLHLENLDSGGDESGLEAIDFVGDLVFFDSPRGRDFVVGSANEN
jgi:hypothetical protein